MLNEVQLAMDANGRIEFYVIITSTNKKDMLVDLDDIDKYYQYDGSWSDRSHRNTSYGRLRGNRIKKLIHAHHIPLGIPPAGLVVKHKNHNGLDNRKKNICFGTNRSNQHERVYHNQRLCGTSKRSGNLKRPWRAYTTFNGKQIQIGWYMTEIEAHFAYLIYCISNEIEYPDQTDLIYQKLALINEL